MGTVPESLVTSDIDPSFHEGLFGEFQHETAIGKFRLAEMEPRRRKSDLAFKFSVRDLQTMNEAAARHRTRTAETHHQDPAGIDRHFHRSPIDAGKRDGDQDFGIGLGDIGSQQRSWTSAVTGWKN